MILDCYQSAGIVPLDVTALGVDFAVGGSVKWLCGGPGNGWLYVRPDLAERLEPTFTGWQAHEAPFAFEEEMRYADGRGAVPHRDAERAGALRGDGGLRPDRGGRRRADPRQLAAPDRAADRPRRRAPGSRCASPRDAGAARRHGDGARARLPGRAPRARGAADPLRLPPGRRDPARAALLHDGRRAPLRDRRRSARSSRRAPTSATSAPSRSTEIYLRSDTEPGGTARHALESRDRSGGDASPDRRRRRRGGDRAGRARAVRPVQGEGRPLDPRAARGPARRRRSSTSPRSPRRRRARARRRRRSR